MFESVIVRYTYNYRTTLISTRAMFSAFLTVTFKPSMVIDRNYSALFVR